MTIFVQMKVDRNTFDAFLKAEEPNDFNYWKTKTVAERLAAAEILNSIAFNYDINDPPKVDRTVFEMIKADER